MSFCYICTGLPDRGNEDIFQDNQDANLPTKKRRTERVEVDDAEMLPQDLFEQLRANQSLCDLYQKHWKKIKDSSNKGKIRDTHNFRLLSLDSAYIAELVKGIFDKQKNAFKINVAFGFVLRNNETGELKYHYSSTNTRVLTAPFFIQNREDFLSFLEKLLQQDPLEYARLQRPNSKWVVDLVTNMTLYIFRIPNHPIGTYHVQLPGYISSNKAIISLTNDPAKKGVQYRDNLCFFRCLALHQGFTPDRLVKKTKELFHQYSPDGNYKNFPGVTLAEMSKLEEIFNVNIVVYELVKEDISVIDNDDVENDGDNKEISTSTDIEAQMEDEDQINASSASRTSPKDETTPSIFARLIQRSLDKYEDTMYLNLYDRHFSYITDFKKYSKSFVCRKCHKLWKSGWQLTRHEAKCDGDGSRHKYPGGYFISPPTIFELLEDEGFDIPEQMKFFPYRAVFDFECYLDKSASVQTSDKLTWEAKHIPVSVSVCSNIPDFQSPKCFISEGDPQILVDQMMNYLLQISNHSKALMQESHQSIFQELDTRINDLTPEEDTAKSDDGQKQRKYFIDLKTRLENYISELPVIGFNSGKYDINVIKPYIYNFLANNEKIKFIVKRNNDHMCIKTENLKFLDITNFLAPGFSYAKFLKAYDCELQKGFFPYEWLDSVDKLNTTQLPSRRDFFSTLKNENISEEDYMYCRKIWEEKGMTTMHNFLEWYNNLDVEPFIEALEKMNEFYRIRGIDTFKDGISVPGLTLKYLFKISPEAEFALFDEKNKDLHQLFKANLVGGPSIVFHRYHEVGKTNIRGDKMCKKVVGYDANALYLWAIMQDMPTGMHIRRLEETSFKKEKTSGISMVAQEWLRWESHTRGIHIRHNGNNVEKRIGPRMLPVDGFCLETKQVFEMQGCRFHGHACQLNPQHEEKEMKERYARTMEKKEYIEDQGYEFIEMWECEFYQMKRNNKQLQHFIHGIRPPLYKKLTLTQNEIIQAVLDDKLFGCVECDIRVPDSLKPHFEEMPPIFKNVDITLDDIGDFMRKYAKEHNVMTTPRRSLIGSMFGEKILLSTPLLKWYLRHGLQVTRIYQVVENSPKACFRHFGNSVSDARRDGDVDPSKAIIADTMKLIGNSSYGKTITNKDRHMNVKVLNTEEARKQVNEPLFRDIVEVTDDCHEVVMAKKTIVENLPIHIGFFVYQYAKLRMLEFYFDFLDKYLHRSDFQYVQMDTDSAYIALSGDSIEELVKPELRAQYHQDKSKWFPRNDTPENAAYDKRTPGLFKVEWEGDGVVALCSKTYYCFGSKDKFSCKGISKKCNDIDKDTYLRVLFETKSASGINRGFRVKDNAMFTYSQTRDGITYFYPKRKVLQDRISTTFLDI